MKPDGASLGLRWREVDAVVPGTEPGTRIFQADTEGGGHLMAMVSPPFAGAGWHVSLSHRSNLVDPWKRRPMPDRLPTWDELVACRYKFIPNECQVAMLLPPVEEYINVMPTCFHLHEVADAPMPVVKR